MRHPATPMPRPACDPAEADRYDRGVSVATAAAIIGCDPSRVRKLLKRKPSPLRGYRDGRSVRIYLSSIEDYRQRNEIGGDAGEAAPAAARPRARSTARYREACALLGELGILPPAR